MAQNMQLFGLREGRQQVIDSGQVTVMAQNIQLFGPREGRQHVIDSGQDIK